MRNSRLAIVLAVTVLELVLPTPSIVHGLGGPLLTAVKGMNTVDIDGTFGAAEWTDAQHVQFNWAYNNDTSLSGNTADLWLKNNGTHLELAFAVNGTAQYDSGSDYYDNQITLLFDHNNNGVVDNYDSLKLTDKEYFVGGYTSNYLDEHYNASMNVYEWDNVFDGAGNMHHTNPGGPGRFTAEFSMSLLSVNGPEDFTLPVNGTIGFEILWQQIHWNGVTFATISTGEACWPAGPPNCYAPGSSYGPIVPQGQGWATIIRSNDGPIADTNPPVIGGPSIQPTSPTSNDNVKVTSLVTDDYSGVKNVSLTYTTDKWVSVNRTLSMSYDQNTHLANATIAAQSVGVRVQYYLKAYDYSGNRALNNNGTSYFHYDVRAPTPPGNSGGIAVSDPVISPTSPGPGDTVTVTVTVTDSQSTVTGVQLWYSSNNWQLNYSVTMTYDPSSYVAHGQISSYPVGAHVEYYIVASDAQGSRLVKNNNGSYYSYNVGSGSQPPPWSWPFLIGPDLTLTSGFLFIAIPIIIALTILMYARRRIGSAKHSGVSSENSHTN